VRTFIIIGLIVVVGALSAAAASGVFSAGESVQAAKAARMTIREFIDERGKTTLPEDHIISMPFAGRISPITLEEGDQVSTGANAEPVALVAPNEINDELAEAQAAVERLEASIAENQFMGVELLIKQQAEYYVESMKEAVAAARKETESSKRSYDYAETFFADTARLAKSDVRTADDVQRADVQRVEREVDYYQSLRYTTATEAIDQATKLLPSIVDSYMERKAKGTDVLRKQLAEAQARLRQVQLRQERGVMRSPVDGVVLEKMVDDEQFLPAGATIMKIGDLSQLEAQVEVLSQDVVRISPGDLVEIYGPATGREVGQGLRGEVKRINPAGFTKTSSLGVEQQRVKVIVVFAEGELDALQTQQPVGVDYRVRARIFTAEKENALTIPRTALFRGADGGWQVFVIRRGVAQRISVEIGLANDEHAEVLTELEENELVILAPESSLEEGAKVDPTVR